MNADQSASGDKGAEGAAWEACGGGEGRQVDTTNSHLHRAVAPAADELVRDEVDAVHLVRVPGQVRFDFVRLEVPELSQTNRSASGSPLPNKRAERREDG